MSLYGRMFAAMYDRMTAGTEEAGLAEKRARLLSQAGGDIVEIGAGTGANLRHYGARQGRLVLTEPEEPMARRLRDAAAQPGISAEVVEAPAEALPFPDESFDTAVSTLALCTVSDPERAIGELRRVLRSGGRLLFLEHVRADDPGLARWQDRLAPVWRAVGHGCNCNRPTAKFIQDGGFAMDELRQDQLPKAPPLVRPLIVGRALAP